MYEKSALVAFGERLKRLRKQALLSQVTLADRARVSQATISRVERGEYPTLTTTAVDRLASALGCTTGQLLQDTRFVPKSRVPYQWRSKPTWK
jgi:transcriptional regulator with XRE-family HTH domain